jgi:Fis family transcriptional regulator, factor for inversion stimulation protein
LSASDESFASLKDVQARLFFRNSFRFSSESQGNWQTVVKKKTKRDAELKTAGKKPLRKHAEEALDRYFATLNGDRPGDLYDLVLGEVEEPLFKAVMDYTHGNQSQAAGILGINRATLRKKLKSYALIR